MDNRKRILFVQKALLEQTDENHDLSLRELSEVLKRECNATVDPDTLSEDLKALSESGFEIEKERARQNRYRYIGREFDRAELKLIIDAVQASRFITKSKSDALVKKICRLAGPDQEGLSRNTEVENRIRNGNKKLFLIIDVLNQAIEKKRQVSYLYFKYNEKKEKELLHKGAPYRINPSFLVWTGEYYYLVGSYANHPENVVFHRIDRILDPPTILEEPSLPMPDSFDPERYLNGTIHMFGGADLKQECIRLLCDNSVANGIIDRFGLKIEMIVCDKGHFISTVQVAPTSVFYGWVFGFGGKVRILEPEHVVREYREMVEKGREKK